MAELWAIYEALRRAWEKGFRSVELESDCVDAIQMILGHSDVCMGHVLVDAIRSLLCRDWQLSIFHVPRGCNACADRLAALGRGQVVEVLEFEAQPAELLDLVEEEAASSG
ncbi:hypothetical protein GQ457_13G011460 [Hibiscus cannabinus]